MGEMNRHGIRKKGFQKKYENIPQNIRDIESCCHLDGLRENDMKQRKHNEK